mmetsp:Transcript_43794/g.140391  ORF Transcript_43794/g.140391 Transcript_43794/m.140391 type:complete len:103 (-) Transcript_43794:600-908(-)
MHHGITDSIEVHMSTWFMCMLLFGVLALLSRLTEVNIMDWGTPVLAVVAVAILFSMKLFQIHMEHRVNTTVNSQRAKSEWWTPWLGCHQRREAPPHSVTLRS